VTKDPEYPSPAFLFPFALCYTEIMGRMRPVAGRILSIFLVTALLLTQFALAMPVPVLAAGPVGGQEAPANPDFEAWLLNQRSQVLQPALKSAQSTMSGLQTEERSLGLVPRPIDLRHLDRLPVTSTSREQSKATAGSQAASSGAQSTTYGTLGLPATFDWRTQGKVTPIRNQSSCGTCWAFGTMAAFESRTWIQVNSQNDFSEQNLVCCSDPAWSYLTGRRCSAGGWDFIAVDTLIKKGARLESCDPYNTSTINSEACLGCTTSYRATGFRTVCYTAAGSEAAIKDAIYNYGPVEAAFYYSGSYVYDGYIIHQPGSTSGRNHLICIVGWDDTFSYRGVTGAWIIKNSWGTTAGQNGYYYMTYGSSNLGDVGYFSSVSTTGSNETLYYYDEAGIVSALGYGGSSAWMASVFTASQDGQLTAVDFWTTSSNAQYVINVYSGSFGSLLATQSGTCAEEGYYSIPLISTVNLSAGQQFTVAVKLTTLGYNYPLPVERAWSSYCNPPIQTGVSFAKHYDGDAWSDLGSAYTTKYNACLRARVGTSGSTSQELIGVSDTATSTGGSGSGPNVTLQRFQAAATGNVSQIRVKASSSSNVKVAIYADSSGSPSTLLAANNTGTAVTAGWNPVTITTTAVTAGSYYWLSVVSSTYNICYMTTPSASSLWQTNNYATWSYPSSPGSGWNTQTGYTYFMAAWGSTAAPPSPTLPAVTNSTGASNITSAGGRLNGELTSTGNADTMVHIYWGDNDGGTGTWDNDINLGTRSEGTFSSDISGLAIGTTYYYRCSAQNSEGTGWAASTASFTTATTTTQKLAGVDESAVSTGGSGSGPNVTLQRFQAAATGNVSQIRVKASSSSNVKVAIYADSSGSPSTLLAANNTGTAVTAGWNPVTITTTAVTAGSYYWLAVVSSTYNICYMTTPSASSLWQTNNYATWSYPSSPGSGWNTQAGYTYFMAAWGSTAAPPSHTLPAVTN